MPERRMFAKTIIDSDAFLDMPLSAQALYFHLNMRADDDGFINNPKKIMRMIGASDDDCRILFAKNFVIPFESGVVVIKHWRIHNYIRGDRKRPTVYREELELLDTKDNEAYTLKKDIVAIDSEEREETPRQKAYRESSLPYSFEYKIRRAFTGKKCPICGATMKTTVDEDGVVCKSHLPTIQHNIPISKGGKHELGNISVICHQCNVTIKDNETGELNAGEVIRVWDEICQSNVSQLTDNCHTEVRLGKDRLSKVNINTSVESELAEVEAIPLNDGSEWKPTVTEYNEYVRLYPAVDVDDEFRRMRAWCQSNPTNRKTRKGVKRFVNGWLSRSQNTAKPIRKQEEKKTIDWSSLAWQAED